MMQRFVQKNSWVVPVTSLVLLIAFSTALSVGIWMKQSLRLDEAQSIWQTSRDLPGVITVIARDVHTPLYFIALHFWELVFGTSEMAIRALSLVFFALCIPAMFYLAEVAYSRRAGYVAAILTAISPFLNWYGSEARMYSMLMFFAIASHCCFILLWKTSAPDGRATRVARIGYAVSIVLGVLTHFFFYFVILSQAIFYLSHRKIFAKDSLGYFVRTSVLAGLIGGGWSIYRVIAGAGLTAPALAPPSSVDLSNLFSNFFIGFQSEYANTMYLSLWPILVLMGFTFLARKKWASPETAYLAVSAFAPIAVAFAVSLFFRPIFLSRYLIICLPSLYLLVVYFLLSYRRHISRIAATAVVALMLSALTVQAMNPDAPVKENYRQAAEYLNQTVTPEDLVVVSAPFITYPVEYYYTGASRLATFPKWERYTDEVTPPPYSEELLAQDSQAWSRVYRDVYLLLGYDQGYEEDVRVYMDTHYQRVDMKQFSPGLSLYVYRLRYLE